MAQTDRQLETAFLTALSHDLRAPIGALVHQAQLLGSADLSDELRSRSVETLRENARLLTRMMDDLIDIERLSQGELRPVLQTTTLSQILEAVHRDDSEAEMAVEVSDPDATAMADPRLMTRAIRTLVTAKRRRFPNAPVTLSGRRKGSDLEITVRANGDSEPSHAPSAARAVDFRLTRKLIEAHRGSMAIIDHGVVLTLPTVA